MATTPFPYVIPLILAAQAFAFSGMLVAEENGDDYVINALRAQRESRERQEKIDRDKAITAGNEQARSDAYARDSAQAHWEGQRQAQMEAENAAYYERVRREREETEWQQYRQAKNFRCPIVRPPDFPSRAAAFAYWAAHADADPWAAVVMGHCLATGDGTTVDHDAAIAALLKSNQNWPETQTLLGFMLMQADVKYPDHKQGLELMQEAAANGYPDAMFCLATCYHRGIGVERDPTQMFMWLYTCFIVPTTDGDPYLEPSYRMLSEEHDHIDRILAAVTGELAHPVIRPWGAYDQKRVFDFIAASAIATADVDLWYAYALGYPDTLDKPAFMRIWAMCNGAQKGSLKAIRHLLSTPSDATELYATDNVTSIEAAAAADSGAPDNGSGVGSDVRLTFSGLLSDHDRDQFVAVLAEQPASAETMTGIARIRCGDLGGDPDPDKAEMAAEQAAKFGDFRPLLQIARNYSVGMNGWPNEQAAAKALFARIPATAWNAFHQPLVIADPRDKAVVDSLTTTFALHRTVNQYNETATIGALTPYTRAPADADAMSALFEQGFAVETNDPRAALAAYATAAGAGNLTALVRIAQMSATASATMPGRLGEAQWGAAVAAAERMRADAGDEDAATALADRMVATATGAVPAEARAYFQSSADKGQPAAAAWMGVVLALDQDGHPADATRAAAYDRVAVAGEERWQAFSARYAVTACAYDAFHPQVADALKAVDDEAAQRAAIHAAQPAAMATLTAMETHPLAYDADRIDRGTESYNTARTNEFMGFEDSAPKQDLGKAFAAYVDAASHGYGWAALNIANFYAKGRCGLAVDEAIAKRWRAVGRTLLEFQAPFDGEAAENLGLGLIDGPDAQQVKTPSANQWLDRDVPAGVRILKTAAVTNQPHAAAMLATYYMEKDEALYQAWVAISNQLLNDDDDAKAHAEAVAAGLAAAKKLLAAEGSASAATVAAPTP